MRRQRFSLSSLLLAVVLAALFLTGLTRPADNLTLAAWFNLRGPATNSDDILIVGLDETFSAAYPYRIGELDRRFYARALDNLNAAGARVVGMDIFFPELSNAAADQALAEAILSTNVVLPRVRQATDAGSFIPAHPLLTDAQRGVLSLEESALYFLPQVEIDGNLLPSFTLAVLEAAGLRAALNTNEQVIDFRGPAGSFPHLSLLNVYRNEFSYAEVKDKLVLLGVTLTGTDRDQIVTPFGEMSGVEVNANQLHTLVRGGIDETSPSLYALLVLLSGLVWPLLAKRKRGLLYTVLAAASVVALSLILFRLKHFLPPLWLALMPPFAYLSSSYRQLLKLDTQLTSKLEQVLNIATTNLDDATPNRLSQGFAPKGYVMDAPDMLASLLNGLGGSAGILIIDGGRAEQGKASNQLLALANETMRCQLALSSGTMPHHLSRLIKLADETIGILALTLPAPPPPHLETLLDTSINTFSQLARYQQLRERTHTITDTVWPWSKQSSLDKIDALAMLGDLLATERSWLGALIESLPQAVFIMSPYGYSIYKNAAARRLFGEQKNMLAAIPERLRISASAFQQDYGRMVEGGDTLELGLSERTSPRPVLLTLRVVRDDVETKDDTVKLAEVKGVAGIVSDLSIVQELDRKRQEMIALVAHDLRSPLTSIQGFTDILLSSADASNQEALEIIQNEAARMKRMTDIFLDVSRLEADIFELNTSSTDVAQLLRYAVATVSTQAGQKDITIAVSAPTYLAAELDADLMSRLLINLLANAIKYSPSSTRVTATLKGEAAQLSITIADEGYGMTEQQRSQLFEKYKRADDARTRNVSGTGLGLYLVKLIVEEHGGTIEVSSVPDEGSQFNISLPLTQARTAEKTALKQTT